MTTIDETSATATELVGLLRSRQIGAREAVEEALGRIDRLNPQVNAVVTIDAEQALVRADQLDRAAAAGRFAGALHGLPVTVKDTIETAGLRTTAGSRRLADHVPAEDAPAVHDLRRAGAIVLGKTNVPSMASDYQTSNALFGLTRNPWDLDRTPGGSSGGSAAAVASGMVSVDLCSDTAGSLTLPAHYCGISGHKPTFGVVSTLGHLPPDPGSRHQRDLSVFGPLTRTVKDAALVFDALVAHRAEPGWRLDLPPSRTVDPSQLRVGVWLEAPAAPLSTEVRQVLLSAIDRVAGRVSVVEVAPVVDLEEVQLQCALALAAASSIHLDDARFEFAAAAAGGMTAQPGSYTDGLVLGSATSHRDWLCRQEWRLHYRHQWARFFEEHDVVVCPVSPVTAYEHQLEASRGERTLTLDDAEVSYYAQLAWPSVVALAGLPATVLPAGRTASGLPVGMQVIGPWMGDRTCLAFAALAESILSGAAS